MLLSVLAGCSDLGTEPWQGWTKYDLAGAEISVPSELEYGFYFCDPFPCNPFWQGTFKGAQLFIEYCLFVMPPFDSLTQYKEEPVILADGTTAILFTGTGPLHLYDPRRLELIGVKMQVEGTDRPLIVTVAAASRDAFPTAKTILKSIRHKPLPSGSPD